MLSSPLSAVMTTLVAVLIVAPAHGQSQRAETLRAAAAREYVAAFRDTGLIPILLPRGQQPGDVIASSGEVLSRRDDCFRAVDVRDDPSRLPNVELSWSAAARFTLAADDLAEASARGQAENLVKVRFEEVRSVSASRVQLARQVRADTCPALARALRDSTIPAQDWLLLGEVLVGKPVVDLKRAQGGGASLSFLAGLAKRLGLSARAEGGADLARAETAELRSEQPVPIAFRPSMVVVTPELAQRYRAASAKTATVEAFNDRDEAHRAAVDAWSARLADSVR